MPYEHDSGDAAPKPAAWTKHPLASDLAWFVLGLFMLATLLRNDGPRLLVAVYTVLLAGLAVVAIRREQRRRNLRSAERG